MACAQPYAGNPRVLANKVYNGRMGNALGPLLNPARPRRQFIGVSDPATARLYRYFLEDSGVS